MTEQKYNFQQRKSGDYLMEVADLECRICGRKLTEHSGFYGNHEYVPINPTKPKVRK